MKALGLSLMLATVFAAASSVVGTSQSVEQPPATAATVFRDIARRENRTVVSITTTSRVRAVLPASGSGFIISSAGDILTNNHLVEDAEQIDVRLFGNERKRYRAIRVGSDPLSDSALIRLQNPPPHLQAATLGDSSLLESGDWVMAISNPFQLGHSVTVGVVSFPQRPFQVGDGRWQDLIQTDASINLGSSGGPLFNVHGEVVGINVAIVDAESDANVGIGFAVPINTVKELLPQLRNGKVVRGQLGVQLHGGPILDDEVSELRLPKAAGTIVMSVDGDSAAEHAGLRAGDVIVEIDGRAVNDTRDFIARTASTAPGTRVTVKIIRDGMEETHTAVIEEQPVDVVEEAPADDSDQDDGLTLGEIGPPWVRDRAASAAVGRAIVVRVTPGSPADDAELIPGDVIVAINGRPIHTSADATRELRAIERDRPVFLLVSRHGTNVFLEMRRD